MSHFAKDSSILLGDNIDRWGEPTPIAFPTADLGKHMIVTGTTGSGKSTLLRNLALQFFKEGGTVIVLDPHDDLILEAADGLLPTLAQDPDPQSQENTILLDFAGAWPPQMNLLTSGPVRERAVQVERAMRCIEAAEDANWGGAVRMREILEHALHVVLHRFGAKASMFDVEAFLSEPALRHQILDELKEDQAIWESRRFWDRTHQLIEDDPRQTDAEMMQYPLRRIGRFLTKPLLRRTLALTALRPKQALDLEALLNAPEPSMILVPLAASRLGEDTKRILGTLLLQQISDIFKARAAQARVDRKPVLVLIDEFAELAASDQIGKLVKNLLAQDRKFGAAVLLATQSLAQLPPEVRLEVRNNANNKIVLRAANWTDAEAAVSDMGSDLLRPLDALDLQQFYGYARLLVEGEPQAPCSFRALPMWRPSRPMTRQQRATPRPWPTTSYLAELGRLYGLAPQSPLEEEQHGKATDVKTLFADLVAKPDSEFANLVAAQQELNATHIEHLLANPQMESDRVKRLRALSEDRWGMPWWFYEAQYRRLRQKMAVDATEQREQTDLIQVTPPLTPPPPGGNGQAPTNQAPGDLNQRDGEPPIRAGDGYSQDDETDQEKEI